MTHDAPATATRLIDARVRLPGNGSIDIPMQLHYDARDPFAVTVTFLPGEDDPLKWALSRDLLRDGLRQPAGQGDVRLRPTSGEGADEVELVLLAATGRHAEATLPAEAVTAFLEATHLVVPPGAEAQHLDIDTAILQLLSH